MSGNKQRRFTDKFKREAVRLIETSGRSVPGGGPAAVTSQEKISGRWLLRREAHASVPGDTYLPRGEKRAA
jgi:hypothetical protein